MTQQLKIAAADHRRTALDQADDRVADRGGLPGFCGDAIPAVNRDGDLAVAGAVRPAVRRLQHQAQSAALLARHARVGWHQAASGRTPIADQSFEPAKYIVVERDQCCQGLLRRSTREEKKLRDDALYINGIATFGSRATLAGPDRWNEWEMWEEFGALRQDQNSRID